MKMGSLIIARTFYLPFHHSQWSLFVFRCFWESFSRSRNAIRWVITSSVKHILLHVSFDVLIFTASLHRCYNYIRCWMRKGLKGLTIPLYTTPPSTIVARSSIVLLPFYHKYWFALERNMKKNNNRTFVCRTRGNKYDDGGRKTKDNCKLLVHL